MIAVGRCPAALLFILLQCAPALPLTGGDGSAFVQVSWKKEERATGKSAVQMNTAMLARMRAKSGQGRACGCLEWKEVYSKKQIACGQGLEFYTWLGRGRFQANDTMLEQLKADRRSLYRQVCTNFFEKLGGNRAVRIKFNTPPSERNQPWDNSWCYVSPACEVDEGQVPGSGELKLFQKGNLSGTVQGAPMGIKVLSGEAEEIVLSQMNPNAVIRASFVNGEADGGYDLTTMMGFAFYAYQDGNKTPSTDLQKQIVEAGAPIMIVPPGPFGTRLLIKGGEKWTIEQNTNRTSRPGSWWTGAPKYDK